MLNNPFISIIINCYNSDEFLKKSIDSVYSQTYKNWEIIFWDNNSSDKSSSIAKSYDKKLIYFKSNKTTRLYEARNEALKKCKGDFVAFLDCDDMWVESKLQKQVQLLKKNCNIIYGGYDNVDENDKLISVDLNNLVSGSITNYLFKRNMISIGCVLIKKSVLLEYKFDPYYDLLGDYDLWVRLSLRYKFCVIKEVLEHSRQHKKNISKSLKHKWLKERRYFYRKYFNFFLLLKYPYLNYYILRTEILGKFGKHLSE